MRIHTLILAGEERRYGRDGRREREEKTASTARVKTSSSLASLAVLPHTKRVKRCWQCNNIKRETRERSSSTADAHTDVSMRGVWDTYISASSSITATTTAHIRHPPLVQRVCAYISLPTRAHSDDRGDQERHTRVYVYLQRLLLFACCSGVGGLPHDDDKRCTHAETERKHHRI